MRCHFYKRDCLVSLAKSNPPVRWYGYGLRQIWDSNRQLYTVYWPSAGSSSVGFWTQSDQDGGAWSYGVNTTGNSAFAYNLELRSSGGYQSYGLGSVSRYVNQGWVFKFFDVEQVFSEGVNLELYTNSSVFDTSIIEESEAQTVGGYYFDLQTSGSLTGNRNVYLLQKSWTYTELNELMLASYQAGDTPEMKEALLTQSLMALDPILASKIYTVPVGGVKFFGVACRQWNFEFAGSVSHTPLGQKSSTGAFLAKATFGATGAFNPNLLVNPVYEPLIY